MVDTESVVREFYMALSRGEAGAALALLDPEVRWTEAERTPYYAGELTGPDAVAKTVLEPIARHFEGFAATPDDFITQNERTVALGLYTGHFRVGGELRAPFVHVWTVRTGRIVRFVQYTESSDWADAILGKSSTSSSRPAFF